MMQSSKSVLVVAMLGVSLLSAAAAWADDGGISFGGAPYLLGPHKNISMKSEVIRMDIGKELIRVDCQFVFLNAGPRTRVRMGFPDQGRGAEDPDYWNSERKGGPIKGTFLSYKSIVDGKLVPTTTVKAKEAGAIWHEKTVSFKPHSTCRVHDVYTLKPGGQVTKSGTGLYSQTSYVLHTARSWRGAIGSAVIIANFQPGVLDGPVQLRRIKTPAIDMNWDGIAANVCYYEGFGKPQVTRSSLTFSKKNFLPTSKDDIFLYYGHHKLSSTP